jgi:hypothetical protein
MKFKLLFLFSILIYSNYLYAQKWLISIGPSFPMGTFASSDIYSPYAGLASLGETLEVGYLIKQHKNVSFLIKAHGERNPINRSEISRQYDQMILGTPGGPPSTLHGAPVTNWSFENHSWWTTELLAGIEVETKDKNKQRWYGQGLLGGVFVKSPSVNGSAYNDSTHTGYNQSSSSAYGFNYQIKAGMILISSKRLAWDIGLVYSGTNNVGFKNITSSFYYNHYNGNVAQAYVYQYSNKREANQVISSLQLLIGIRF